MPKTCFTGSSTPDRSFFDADCSGRARPAVATPCLIIQRGLFGLALLCALLLPVLPVAAEDATVFVASARDLEQLGLSEHELAAIFLGQKRYWDDGTRVRLALPKSEDVQRPFLNAVVGRSPRQYWAHWRNIVFAGRGLMPKTFRNEAELVRYLADKEGAIGPVDGSGRGASADLHVLEVSGVSSQ